MWPFKKKPKLAPGKKLALIAAKDYPKEAYSAYWEIGVSAAAPFYWRACFIGYAGEGVIDSGDGGPLKTENDARRESQQWVLDRIENYRRKSV